VRLRQGERDRGRETGRERQGERDKGRETGGERQGERDRGRETGGERQGERDNQSPRDRSSGTSGVGVRTKRWYIGYQRGSYEEEDTCVI
jgi:hypothetical protein